MDHAVDLLDLERVTQLRGVGEGPLDQERQGVDGVLVSGREIVEYDRRVTCADQFLHDDAADVASAADHERVHPGSTLRRIAWSASLGSGEQKMEFPAMKVSAPARAAIP